MTILNADIVWMREPLNVVTVGVSKQLNVRCVPMSDRITIEERGDGKYKYIVHLSGNRTAAGTGYTTPESALKAAKRWFP